MGQEGVGEEEGASSQLFGYCSFDVPMSMCQTGIEGILCVRQGWRIFTMSSLVKKIQSNMVFTVKRQSWRVLVKKRQGKRVFTSDKNGLKL